MNEDVHPKWRHFRNNPTVLLNEGWLRRGAEEEGGNGLWFFTLMRESQRGGETKSVWMKTAAHHPCKGKKKSINQDNLDENDAPSPDCGAPSCSRKLQQFLVRKVKSNSTWVKKVAERLAFLPQSKTGQRAFLGGVCIFPRVWFPRPPDQPCKRDLDLSGSYLASLQIYSIFTFFQQCWTSSFNQLLPGAPQ